MARNTKNSQRSAADLPTFTSSAKARSTEEKNLEIAIKEEQEKLGEAEKKLAEGKKEVEKAEERLAEANADFKEAEKNLQKAGEAEEFESIKTLRTTRRDFLSNLLKTQITLGSDIEKYKQNIQSLKTKLENVNFSRISNSSVKEAFLVDLRNHVSAPSIFGKNPQKGDHSNIFLPRKQNQISFKEGRVPVIVGSEIFNDFVNNYQYFLSNPMKGWSRDKEDLFVKFVNDMKTYFFNENERTTSFTDNWNILFDNSVVMNARSGNSTSSLDISSENKSFIIKVKNEGTGINAEAFTEALGYFINTLNVSDSDSHERILITLVGTQISVYGAVCSLSNKFIMCEPLLQPLWFCSNFEECRALLRALHVYMGKDRTNVSVYPNYAVPENSYSDWEWISDKDVCHFGDHCIKFSQSYSTEVHEKYSENGFAPMLRGNTKRGKWTIIEMQFLEGFEQLSISNSNYSPSQVEQLITKLQDLGKFIESGKFVHGDLRPPNIMVKFEDGGANVKVVDFAWAGIADEVYYPSNLSKSAFSAVTSCQPCIPIEIQHDLDWLDYIIAELKKLPQTKKFKNSE